MTATPGPVGRPPRLGAVSDTLALTTRNLLKVRRVPEILFSVLITPVVFVLLFAWVFGSSIQVPGGSYREFLNAGTFSMTLAFNAVFTGAGLAEDMRSGIIARFRSLPMSRSAVVVARTASDVLYNIASLAVMAVAGLAVGWRIHTDVGRALLGFVLLLGFAYAISWVMALIGLMAPAPEVVSNSAFMVIFPMTFLANTFTPTDGFPAPLRAFADHNPVSALAQPARELFGNMPAGTPEPTAWPLQHPVAYTVIWIIGTIAVFAPLAVRRYQRMT